MHWKNSPGFSNHWKIFTTYRMSSMGSGYKFYAGWHRNFDFAVKFKAAGIPVDLENYHVACLLIGCD
jgi:hypothetical protein